MEDQINTTSNNYNNPTPQPKSSPQKDPNPPKSESECRYIYENMTEREKKDYDLLIQNLPVLQNKINRDSIAYKEDFDKILAIFKEQFNIILFTPNKTIKGFKELLIFLSHISDKYKNELSFYPEILIKILQENYLIIPHTMRIGMVESLSLLRKKDLISPLEVLPLFFSLLKCQDKILRKKLTDCIISDLTKINTGHKNNSVNKNLQTFCEKLLLDPNRKMVRKTINIMIVLYQKKIWNDSRTINSIANCVNLDDDKIIRAMCQFFLSEYDVDNQADTSSEEELDDLKNKYKLLGLAKTKKTKDRKEKLKSLLKSIERKESRQKKSKVNKDFMPIDQLYDPLSFCEKLLKKSNSQKVKFNIKILIIRLLSRVLGRHRLLIPNYFSFILNFMNNNQKDVNVILASLVEACHDQIPPNLLEPIMQKMYDNFVSENFRPQLITLGLNTVREIIERCPYSISKSDFEVIKNLKLYKHKSVANAARSIVNLCKEIDGKYGKVENFLKSNSNFFGQNKIDDTVEGIELLKKLEKKPKDYKMEYEEILNDTQLKKLKALKLKYNAELLQHKRTRINSDEINDIAGEKKQKEIKNKEDYVSEEGNEGDEEEEDEDEDEDEEEGNEGDEEEEEGELESLEDEENELDELEEEEEGELEEIEDDDDNLEEVEDNDYDNLKEIDEGSEQIELSESEINPSDEEDVPDDQGFVNPDDLAEYRKTRREKREELKNQQKEKFKLNNLSKKTGSKTNKEKERNKPMAMLMPKKRLNNKQKGSKLQSMNKKIKHIKQQLGRFKRGNKKLKKKAFRG